MIGLVHIPHTTEWQSLLSHRQCRVALLVARGLTNKQVARELGLREGTVKVHLHSIFVKLGVKSRNDLINGAIPKKHNHRAHI